MKRLKKRTRSDTHVSEARVSRPRSWDRNVYLALLIVFFAGLGNYVFGDRLFLRADGLVLQNRTEIGATGLVQITEVAVEPGQQVESDDMLVRAESIDTLGKLAELTMREAELAERGARLRAELVTARALRPRAETRLEQLRRQDSRLADLDRSGLLSASRRDTHRNDLLDAEDRVTRLAAQEDGLAKEIEALDDRRGHARSAIQQLQSRYRDGLHSAAIPGTVGDRVPAPGEVMNPGETILTLFWGEPYVLAYLPQHYIFEVAAGDEVRVRAGPLSRLGRIEAILPMSQAIPDEFHTAFKLRETRQLARIALMDGPEVPTQATVLITRDWHSGLADRIDDVRARLNGLAGQVIRPLASVPKRLSEAVEAAAQLLMTPSPNEV